MADRNFSPIQALDKQVKIIAGSCAIATSTTGVTANNILGASVARTGTGAFTITLTDKYPELLGIHLQLAKSTAQDLQPQVVAVDVASAKTITFRLLTGATPTDLTTEAGTLYITIVLKNSTIAP